MRADIKRTTAVTSMIILGILAILFAIKDFAFDLTGSTYGFVGLGIGIILLTEIGMKRLTKLSKLKVLNNQNKISLIIAVIVIVTSIGLLFSYELPILSNISNGSFLTGGVFVILEALTF